LGTPNKYMEELVPQMVDDMLEIVLDPLLPPKSKPPKGNTLNKIFQIDR
jgi:hypothetical protein